jgi:hypothetical protein
MLKPIPTAPSRIWSMAGSARLLGWPDTANRLRPHHAAVQDQSRRQAINGWGYTTKTRIYGTDYLMRALVTAIGLGANRPQDAIYPTSLKDAAGYAYDGANKYIVRFHKNQLPPVQGFWSRTMYDADYFFAANPINRYSISARQNLKTNPDGSVDLYIQKDSPGAAKESDWLPAPSGKFLLMMRLYWPKPTDPSILDGSWVIPPVAVAQG